MWPRKHKEHKDKEGLESFEALHESRKDLHEIKARDPEVENLFVDMVRIRERNHFAEQLKALTFKPKGV